MGVFGQPCLISPDPLGDRQDRVHNRSAALMPIPLKTEKYAWLDLPWQKDDYSIYLPDAVLDALFDAARPRLREAFEKHLDAQDGLSPLNRHRLLIPEPQLTLEQSFDLVIRAFDSFDPRLGAKARAVIADPSRWQLEKTETGEAWGKNDDSPPGDGKPRNIIRYFHDGTISDPVYIAHELGHLMANDFAQDAGVDHQHAFHLNPSHLWETQGFFGQHVLYDYLMSGKEGPDLKKAATTHFIGEIAREAYEWPALIAYIKYLRKESSDQPPLVNQWLGERAGEFARLKYLDTLTDDPKTKSFLDDVETKRNQYWQMHGGHATAAALATGFFHIAKDNPELRKKIVDALLIDSGEKRHIVKVFSAAGIETEPDLKKFGALAVSDMMAPLLAAASQPAATKKLSYNF